MGLLCSSLMRIIIISCVFTCVYSLMSNLKFVLIPGNGGAGLEILESNWYAWFKDELTNRDRQVVVRNYPDPFVAKEKEWVPFIINKIGTDENTVLVGHSSGALCAMRMMERMKLKGVILVSAAHTDLGDENERASGYFDREWDWKKMVQNTETIYQFHSDDDHLIPIQEARFVAEQLHVAAASLGKEDDVVYEELSGYSHFFSPFDRLLDVIDSRFS